MLLFWKKQWLLHPYFLASSRYIVYGGETDVNRDVVIQTQMILFCYDIICNI